jgi:hypothetical protein
LLWAQAVFLECLVGYNLYQAELDLAVKILIWTLPHAVMGLLLAVWYSYGRGLDGE